MSAETIDLIVSNFFRCVVLTMLVVTLRLLSQKWHKDPLITVEELPGASFVIRCAEHGPVGVAATEREIGRMVLAHFVDCHDISKMGGM